MTKNIVFRTDASQDIGLGHFMRCLALSEELMKRGNICYFLSRTDNDELINKIREIDVNYQKIKINATLQEDLEILTNFSNENDIDWIITDHYDIDSEYLKKLKEKRFNILSIDDTAQIHYCSDIILNQNIGAEKLEFSIEQYTKLLLGTKYVLIRDELLKKKIKRIEHKGVIKILVMLGGTDADNFTLKVLRMLDEIHEEFRIISVCGPLNPYYMDLKEFSEKSDRNIQIIKSPEKMVDLYLESDMAISAGGSSCYELAYFGIPTIIITVADNQLIAANEFDKQKVSIYVGKKIKIIEEEFKNKVKELINNQFLQNMMSQNGRKLVDGKGKERIIDFMEGFC